jgi:hypothetical protein
LSSSFFAFLALPPRVSSLCSSVVLWGFIQLRLHIGWLLWRLRSDEKIMIILELGQWSHER